MQYRDELRVLWVCSRAKRPEVTARSYRRRDYGRQFDERSGAMLNRNWLPRDIIAFVVFCRLRYR
ncbi:MAG: hypothetical protein ACRYFY_04215 [Janthinobacterium lividum]